MPDSLKRPAETWPHISEITAQRFVRQFTVEHSPTFKSNKDFEEVGSEWLIGMELHVFLHSSGCSPPHPPRASTRPWQSSCSSADLSSSAGNCCFNISASCHHQEPATSRQGRVDCRGRSLGPRKRRLAA